MTCRACRRRRFRPGGRRSPPRTTRRTLLYFSDGHGFRGYDTRQNVYYNDKGEVCYHPPRLAPVQPGVRDPEARHHNSGRTTSPRVDSDDILCMARHPDKVIFATGGLARTPRLSGTAPT